MNRQRAGAWALAAVGVVFVWSAAHGASVLGTLRDLLAGRSHLEPVEFEASDPGELHSAYYEINGRLP